MKRIHIAPSVPGRPMLSFLPGAITPDDILFSDTHMVTPSTVYTFDTTVEEADYILAPHPVRNLNRDTQAYIANMKRYAREHHKPLILFTGGDLQHRISVDGVVLVKGAQYRAERNVNEIQAPPYVEDLSRAGSITIRVKGDKPIVGFCGWAAFPSLFAKIRYYIRSFLLDAEIAITGKKEKIVYKRGLYFRRRAIRLLSQSTRVQTKFIIRKSFSGNTALISVSPQQARREYVDNMEQADFVLAPKGDGNFSLRFYEALSMGRIPVLIDTDVVLPLEEVISYEKCIIRIPWQEMPYIANRIADFYQSLTPEAFADMQRYARMVFTQYLQYDAYLNALFGQLVPQTLYRMSDQAKTTEATAQ